MDCREFRQSAGPLLEGESLPEAQAHRASCPQCQNFIEEISSLGRLARTLPVREPSRALWSRLEKAAVAEGLWERRRWWESTRPALSFFPVRPAYAALLSLLLLAGAGVLFYPYLWVPGMDTTEAPYSEAPQAELVEQAGYSLRYQLHLQKMEQRVLDESGPVDRELRGLVARPLSTVDRCIEETRQRLAEYPDDTLARTELHRLYRQKASLLQAMSDPHWMTAEAR